MKLTVDKARREFLRSRNGSNVLCAVAETDLVMEGGTLTALSGPSGSGKSTLLHMCAGLLPPTDGRILLDETDLYRLEDKEQSLLRNRHIGVVPQGQTALQALNVLDNVLVPYALYGRQKGSGYDEIRTQARDLLEQAGIQDLERVMPSELSGGELRRMAVCRALLLKPAILLADEPTGDLDEENTGIVMGLLKDHAARGGCVFVVTHDRQVWDYADRILEMKKGIVTAQK